MKFKNSDAFRQEALNFIKYGYYCSDPPGTSEYFKYWNEQSDRCRNGYEVDGVEITGYFYFYLNFCRIKLTEDPDGSNNKKKKVGSKKFVFPNFWDGDYEYFWSVEIARNGITKEKLAKLHLENIPTDIEGGNHIILLKRRRAGYSYKNASMAACNYTFNRNSLTIIGAFETKYLYPRGTMTMASEYLNFIDANTAWSKRRLISTKEHIKSGFKETINGVEITKGYQSEITAISFKDKPDAARGKDASLIILEECGTMSGLKSVYAATLPSVQDGNITTGLLIAFGCVCKGTKVWTHKGEEVNIEDLNQEDGIIGYGGKGVTQEPIVWQKPPAKKPCYRIETSGGKHIECSYDHPLLWSINNNSYYTKEKVFKKVTFKKAEDIKVGDQLMSVRQIPIFGKKKMWQPRLVGMLIGDGNYTNKATPQLSVAEEEIFNWLAHSGINISVYKKKILSDGSLFRSVGLLDTYNKLREIGIYGQSKEKKHLPPNIHEYDMHSLSELISGYYDADGNVYYNKKKNSVRIVLTSKYEHLLKEVQSILLKFSIHSVLSKEYRKGGYKAGTVYRLYISRKKDVLTFRNHFHLLVDKKRNTLNKLNENNKGKSSYETVKFEVNPDNGKGTYFKGVNISMTYLSSNCVTSVTYIGEKEVYNLNAGMTHTYISNTFVSSNTGGAMQAGILDFESMFYDPETYDFLAYPNVWDEGAEGNCGYFFPDYQSKVGFMDKQGNSDIVGAKAYAESLRDKIKRTSKDPQAIDLHTVERPFCPREGFLQVTNNIFPVAELNRWRNKLLTTGLFKNMPVHGVLTNTESGIRFKPSETVRPILEFPAKKTSDLSGCITIYQSPYKVDGEIPQGLYIVAVDPYAHDKTTGVSLGAAYVIKRMNNFSLPDDMIVASYVGRPSMQDQFNENLFNLAKYYNAKIGFENDRGNIIDYAKYHKKLNWLNEEFEIIDKTDNIRFGKLGRKYGISMSTKDRKGQASIYLRDWLMARRGKDEDGEYRFNFHFIYDIALLDELIKYNVDGNFDRVSSLLVAMYYLKELYRKDQELVLEEKNEDNLFSRELF